MSLLFRSSLLATIAALFCSSAEAAAFAIQPSDFSPSATVVGFETGSTGLPGVAGMTFLRSGAINSLDWFDSDGNFAGFFGSQGWSNLVSGTYSNIGAAFNPPVQAVGGWFGQISNFTNSKPSKIEVRVFDKDSLLVGDNIVNLIPALHSPVWVGYKSDTLISRVEYRVNQFPDAGFFSGDNLTFGNATPEPSTLALSVLALAALPARRRRSVPCNRA